MSDKRKQADWRKTLSQILIFLGVLSILLGGLFTARSLQEAQYIPAIGRSLSAEIRKDTERLAGSVSSARRWKLYVEYEYWIGGEYFRSTSIGSRQPSSSASGGQPPSPELLTLLEHYKAGNRIDVYVSPDRPERSVLIPLGHQGSLLIFLAVLAFGAAAALRYRMI